MRIDNGHRIAACGSETFLLIRLRRTIICFLIAACPEPVEGPSAAILKSVSPQLYVGGLFIYRTPLHIAPGLSYNKRLEPQQPLIDMVKSSSISTG